MLPIGYRLRQGSGLERAWLVKFMQQTYLEILPTGDFSHLADTVDRYFSRETPVWWVERADANAPPEQPSLLPGTVQHPVAALWLGHAIDQLQGDRHTHIFLLYVLPEYRRQGIGTALMRQAETWAKAHGDRQIGLQVFQANQPALALYQSLGYQPQSLVMVKPLDS